MVKRCTRAPRYLAPYWLLTLPRFGLVLVRTGKPFREQYLVYQLLTGETCIRIVSNLRFMHTYE